MVAFTDNECLVVEISNYVVKEKYKFQISEFRSDIEEEIIDQSFSVFFSLPQPINSSVMWHKLSMCSVSRIASVGNARVVPIHDY